MRGDAKKKNALKVPGRKHILRLPWKKTHQFLSVFSLAASRIFARHIFTSCKETIHTHSALSKKTRGVVRLKYFLAYPRVPPRPPLPRQTDGFIRGAGKLASLAFAGALAEETHVGLFL